MADMQAVHTVAATWCGVVSQIVQRPEGARCSELHTFAIARDDQPAIRPGRLNSAPKGRTADCKPGMGAYAYAAEKPYAYGHSHKIACICAYGGRVTRT